MSAVHSTARRSGLRAAVAGSVAAKTVELLTLVLLATVVPRTLGPSAFGRFSVALTMVTLGSLALTLGGPTLMARVVPTAPVEQRVALARALGARLTRGRALQVTVIAFVLLAVALWNPSLVRPLDAVLVFSAFALNVATSLALQVALGLGHTVPWSARYPLQNTVLVVAVLLLYPAAGVTGALVAILLSAAAGAVLAAAVVGRVAGGRHQRVTVPAGTIRFGILLAGGAALMQFVQRGGVLAVALLGGTSAQVGYAALAIGIVLGLTYAILQAFTVALPHLAGHADEPVAEATLRKMAGSVLVVLVPACAAGAVALDWLVPTVFGDSFRGAAGAFGPALALLVLAPVSALFTQVSALRFEPRAALAGGIVGALVFVVVALATVPNWQATGATAAALAGVGAAAITSVRMLPRAAGSVLTIASGVGATGVLALSFT